MAGGMRRGDGVPLHARVHGTPPPEVPAPPDVKPCWVNGAYGRLPGLLLGWRRTAAGWEGRVVRVTWAEGWVVVEEWVSAGLLERGQG